MTEACASDFAMVGGGSVFDQDGVETRLKCLLPDIAGYVVSPQARGADLVVQPLPNPIDSLGIGLMNYLGAKYPAATKHIGVLTGDLSTTKIVADQQAEAAKAWAGRSSTTTSTRPPARPTGRRTRKQIKSAGVQGSPLGRRAREPRGAHEGAGEHQLQARLHPHRREPLRPEAHRRRRVRRSRTTTSTSRARSSRSRRPTSRTRPVSTSRRSRTTSPDGKSRTYLGLQAWSAWLLFSQAAKECGNDLTRTCMYDNAQEDHGVDRRRAPREDAHPAPTRATRASRPSSPLRTASSWSRTRSRTTASSTATRRTCTSSRATTERA